MNSLGSRVIVLIIVFMYGVYAYSSEPIKSKNESEITYTQSDGSSIQNCKGTISDKTLLKKIGISFNNLEKGINCVAGDFDGNGYVDFLLFGAFITKEPYIPRPQAFLALFYKGHKIILNKKISDGRLVTPFLYPARSKKDQFGEPATKTSGFVEWGEGGTTVIYLFDDEKKEFRISKHASEWH